MQKRKELDFARKSTEDIIMACIHPNFSLPVVMLRDYYMSMLIIVMCLHYWKNFRLYELR